MEITQIKFEDQRKPGQRADHIGNMCLKKRILGAEGKYNECLSSESPISQHGEYIRIQGTAYHRIWNLYIKKNL